MTFSEWLEERAKLLTAASFSLITIRKRRIRIRTKVTKKMIYHSLNTIVSSD